MSGYGIIRLTTEQAAVWQELKSHEIDERLFAQSLDMLAEENCSMDDLQAIEEGIIEHRRLFRENMQSPHIKTVLEQAKALRAKGIDQIRVEYDDQIIGVFQ